MPTAAIAASVAGSRLLRIDITLPLAEVMPVGTLSITATLQSASISKYSGFYAPIGREVDALTTRLSPDQ